MKFEIMPIVGTGTVSIVATDIDGSMYEDPAHTNIPVSDAKTMFQETSSILPDIVRETWTQLI